VPKCPLMVVVTSSVIKTYDEIFGSSLSLEASVTRSKASHLGPAKQEFGVYDGGINVRMGDDPQVAKVSRIFAVYWQVIRESRSLCIH